MQPNGKGSDHHGPPGIGRACSACRDKGYKLGQRVKVVVEDCDTMASTIDFVLAEDEDE